MSLWRKMWPAVVGLALGWTLLAIFFSSWAHADMEARPLTEEKPCRTFGPEDRENLAPRITICGWGIDWITEFEIMFHPPEVST